MNFKLLGVSSLVFISAILSSSECLNTLHASGGSAVLRSTWSIWGIHPLDQVEQLSNAEIPELLPNRNKQQHYRTKQNSLVFFISRDLLRSSSNTYAKLLSTNPSREHIQQKWSEVANSMITRCRSFKDHLQNNLWCSGRPYSTSMQTFSTKYLTSNILFDTEFWHGCGSQPSRTQ